MEYDVYLYGMVLRTTSHLLKGKFPIADTYGEIEKTYTVTGGETGTCATVLANLGLNIKMDGNHLGINTYDTISKFYNERKVDISPMTFDKDYIGLEDYVFIDNNTRTCFGKFGAYFSDKNHKRWNVPNRQDIEHAEVIGLDPFFMEESILVARYCNELGKKYATIDCPFDSELNKYASVVAISHEYINGTYPEQCKDIERLLNTYTDNTNGLVIFTFGSDEVLYKRKSGQVKRFSPYKVPVVSTLGAGDTFKAGTIYGLFKNMNDDDLVSFACATAGVACCNFPIPLNPPTLEQIEKLQKSI